MKINIKNISIKSICAILFISLFLSCNNGIEELEKQRDSISSISKLRQDFLDIFTSFGDMFTDALGIKVDTKKSEIGGYFTQIAETMKKVKEKLTSEVAKNENYAKIETVVNELVKTIEKIGEGAKIVGNAIGTEGVELIGNVISANVSAPAAKGDTGDVNKLNRLIEGMKGIIEVVLGNVGNHDAGDTNKAQTGSARADDGAVKLFDGTTGPDSNAKTVAADAAKAVGSVTGADILQAMVKNDVAAKLAKNNAAIASVASNAKDSTISGAIALRAMAKGGQFANGNSGNDVTDTVKGVAVSAITKALNTLAVAIRKTIDAGLKKVQEAMKLGANATSLTADTGASKPQGK
ncbi:variable large family protein (plasmid) [Borrelia coriaceae]|uniref:Variable large protein n=1 Tax=Borrelia coriaceae ATCC 43381 TaxID=1408429 RepID=W5SVN2_9SPIR|nr:variable large family protein [Borrelia coriaceae]AHH11264.1 Variable outer membrane protein [Borrelia coriaceae ATCC 43381]UPA17431.1 variable large family protein [Borrelia coriaceae]